MYKQEYAPGNGENEEGGKLSLTCFLPLLRGLGESFNASVVISVPTMTRRMMTMVMVIMMLIMMMLMTITTMMMITMVVATVQNNLLQSHI
jgi:hypothetical protein